MLHRYMATRVTEAQSRIERRSARAFRPAPSDTRPLDSRHRITGVMMKAVNTILPPSVTPSGEEPIAAGGW
jgi:hypothetical protein